MKAEGLDGPKDYEEAPPNGAAWAALLSASIGCTGFGVVTDLSECSARASRALQWYRPAGNLSGVAICGIAIWLGAWAVLHARWKGRSIGRERMVMGVIFLLIVAAIVATFPRFYELLPHGG